MASKPLGGRVPGTEPLSVEGLPLVERRTPRSPIRGRRGRGEARIGGDVDPVPSRDVRLSSLFCPEPGKRGARDRIQAPACLSPESAPDVQRRPALSMGAALPTGGGRRGGALRQRRRHSKPFGDRRSLRLALGCGERHRCNRGGRPCDRRRGRPRRGAGFFAPNDGTEEHDPEHDRGKEAVPRADGPPPASRHRRWNPRARGLQCRVAGLERERRPRQRGVC
jgi:hypothetical protein